MFFLSFDIYITLLEESKTLVTILGSQNTADCLRNFCMVHTAVFFFLQLCGVLTVSCILHVDPRVGGSLEKSFGVGYQLTVSNNVVYLSRQYSAHFFVMLLIHCSLENTDTAHMVFQQWQDPPVTVALIFPQ